MKKVLVVGLDGAPYKEIKEWVEKGELSFLSEIYKKGAFGSLKSIIPPFTMLAWPVIFTGKNPGKIGPFLYKGEKKGFNPDFFKGAQFINSTDIKTWTIWEWVSNFNGKVGVMNIPMTYPPMKVNGFFVSGALTPKNAKDFVYPEQLRKELTEYVIDLELPEGVGKTDKNLNKNRLKKLKKEFEILIKNRTKNAISLLKKYSPEFFIINFKEIDDFMHYFWNDKNSVLDYLKKSDESLREIYNQHKPDYVIVISDHGFSKAPTKYFYINQYLLERGYLKKSKSFKSNLFNLTYKAGILIIKNFGFLRNLFSDKLKFKIVRESIKEQVDWENTKAYAHWYAGIYLNPKFYPTPNAKKKGAEEIREALLEAKDPENGNKTILIAKTKWELFKGDFFEEMPEIVYTSTEDYRINTNLPGRIVDKKVDRPSIVGHHTSALDGIIFVMGEGIKKGTHLEANIYDLFPTSCVLMEIPIPKDCDGRVLTEIMEEKKFKISFSDLDYNSYKKSNESHYLTEEEDKSIKEHLKNLGYL
ncbi:MAG: alkaline phosphatase family protein [candidate division WOR-3 bacterium]